MDDISHCPICNLKMRTYNYNKFLHLTGKTTDYAERVCSKGFNHVAIFWVDKSTNQIDAMKFSLNEYYSKFLEINFVKEKSKIILASNGGFDQIILDRIFVPDFPDLKELKRQISLFSLLS